MVKSKERSSSMCFFQVFQIPLNTPCAIFPGGISMAPRTANSKGAWHNPLTMAVLVGFLHHWSLHMGTRMASPKALVTLGSAPCLVRTKECGQFLTSANATWCALPKPLPQEQQNNTCNGAGSVREGCGITIDGPQRHLFVSQIYKIAAARKVTIRRPGSACTVFFFFCRIQNLSQNPKSQNPQTPKSKIPKIQNPQNP